MAFQIRNIVPGDFPLFKEFLYEAIFVPEGVAPPPKSVVNRPELQIYFADFGSRAGDLGLVAESGSEVVGMVWCRLMHDYGHLDDGHAVARPRGPRTVPQQWNRERFAAGNASAAETGGVSPGIPLGTEGEPGGPSLSPGRISSGPRNGGGVPHGGGTALTMFQHDLPLLFRLL